MTVEKIIIESKEKEITIFNEPNTVRIILIIDKTNVTLYEGKKFKNCEP